MQTITVTGSAGFIGSHLVEALRRRPETEVIGLDVDASAAELRAALGRSDAVFHIAGVNRPENLTEYESGNAGFTTILCIELEALGRRPLVVFSSSTQAGLDNEYGRSKMRAEEALKAWSARTGAPVAIFRLPNVFGKWARPNYNSAVATFCHNAAHGLPLTVTDPDRDMRLVYIDDVVRHMLACLDGPPAGCEFREVQPVFGIKLGPLADLIRSFPATRETLVVPDFGDGLTLRLWATYLSHLDGADFAYRLRQNADNRGSLAEMIKSPGFGQIFVSRTLPGITRGNHYHHTKVEKFLVVEGEAVVRFRDIRGDRVIGHRVNGREFTVIDIPPGFTHSIENVGTGELVTLFWADELFDPERPDTYFLPVLEDKPKEGEQ
jgi:UDP-2-acetamido-2,6-beta-L-arabino-hexul-4-ose reductase